MADSTYELRHIAGNNLPDGSQRCLRCCEPLSGVTVLAGRIVAETFLGITGKSEDCTAYDPHPDHEDAEVAAGDRELVAAR